MHETVLRLARKIIPVKIFRAAQPLYHKLLAFAAALIYRFPSREIRIVAVTGTKGKSSTVEFVNAVLETAGKKTALASTIRFKVADDSRRNLYKMTMPGRFFLQRFLRQAVRAGCEYAVIEVTSEGARQFRHRFIELNSLIFLNLAPEHIESHGSCENYVAAKVSLARALERSTKPKRILVTNALDKEGRRFIAAAPGVAHRSFTLKKDAWRERGGGIEVVFQTHVIHSPLPGKFNAANILAAATWAEAEGLPLDAVRRGIENVHRIPGRVERISVGNHQTFEVVVDYAHTPESLEAIYQTFGERRKICVLGNTGGGRDRWKRPKMAAIAEAYCDVIILTNEDPYDEDPRAIVEEMKHGMSHKIPEIVMDRREAIISALSNARAGDVVLITGKGTDPFIMGPRGTKIPWDDAAIARQELSTLFSKMV